MFRVTTLALALVTLLAGSVAAQGEPSPSLSASPEVDATPAPEATPEPKVIKLGGAWRRTSAAPFGAIDVPGGWTGAEVVLVDPGERRRAAAYNPALDAWGVVARPPSKLSVGSQAHWTGSELLFVEPRGAARRGLAAYDPVADEWRSTATSPINQISSSALVGDVIVVVSESGRTAAYDLAADEWTELSPLALPEVDSDRGLSLHSSGEAVFALTVADALAFVPLDLEAGTWGEPSVGPLSQEAADPLWTGDAFTFLTGPADAEPATVTELATEAEPATDTEPTAEADTEPTAEAEPTSETEPAPSLDGRYDPSSDIWESAENPCGIDTSEAVWTDTLILSAAQLRAFDTATGQCYRLPRSPWPERTDALTVWTGKELLQLSGTTDGKSARRDGVAYDQSAENTRAIAVNKTSRPVRVRVPSLGIDLAVIWDGRKIAGGTPGYPACNVAEYWSAFDLPGAPGTTWINAHAQAGMFLPLLNTLRSKGRAALLGRKVELQLRDGRLLTYRTYKVDPRATNANVGRKGLKKDEHRLVLQTSTGIGSAPKLLVAARLIDIDTTDERRPKPQPRACG